MNPGSRTTEPSENDRRIADALRMAGQTRLFRLEDGVRRETGPVFQQLFGQRPAIVIADPNTFAVAGRDVVESLRCQPCQAPLIFEDRELTAEFRHVETLKNHLASHEAIAVAVGSGTINDLVKSASHLVGRPYMVVATAASMDGYAAFGASITRHGSKQTFACPAPVAILADLEVIRRAPPDMNAAGYADLLAKSVAGADWLLAEALGIEPIDSQAWEMVQSRLLNWTANPAGIRHGDPQTIRSLMLGLILSGCAMQWTKTSRPASGAEHQFSHLWDMQHHRHQGHVPWHGFKVALGTLVSSAFYEELLQQPLDRLDTDRAAAAWPSLADTEDDIRARFGQPELVNKALEEMRAKYVPHEQLRAQLARLRTVWPDLCKKLQSHLLPAITLRKRLAEAGCPTTPEDIGISPARLRESCMQAYYLRRRFTVLDLAVRSGLMPSLLRQVFRPNGPMLAPESAVPSTVTSLLPEAEHLFQPEGPA